MNWRPLLYAIVAIGVANFAAFAVIAIAIGGDALNGEAIGDRYFLGSHGKTVEVSRAMFTYSKWHLVSLCVTHPLLFVAGVMLRVGDGKVVD